MGPVAVYPLTVLPSYRVYFSFSYVSCSLTVLPSYRDTVAFSYFSESWGLWLSTALPSYRATVAFPAPSPLACGCLPPYRLTVLPWLFLR